MRDWKTTILLSLIFAALLLAVILPMHTQLPQPYTIFTPFLCPVVPGSPEWLAAEWRSKEACTVPDELAAQMSTKALVETFIAHPLSGNIFAFSSYHDAFISLKDRHLLGLTELMGREDLDEALLEKYREIPVCTAKIPDEMPYETLYTIYENEIEDGRQLDLLDVLAAEIDDGHRSISLTNAILDKADQRAANPRLYPQLPQAYNRVFVRTWAEKHYNPAIPTPRPLYPLVTAK